MGILRVNIKINVCRMLQEELIQDGAIKHVLFKGYIVKVPSMYQVETQHMVLNGTSKIGLILQ